MEFKQFLQQHLFKAEAKKYPYNWKYVDSPDNHGIIDNLQRKKKTEF